MTSDPNDRASEHEEMMRNAAIQSSRKPEGPKPTGKCLLCEERLPQPMRWCDADCRTRWHREQK